MLDRRILLAASLAFALGGAAQAQTEVKVGLIAPLTGPWARQGDLMLKGANLAIEHIKVLGPPDGKLAFLNRGQRGRIQEADGMASRTSASELFNPIKSR